MHRICLPSSLLLAFVVSACSSDSDSDSPSATGGSGGSAETAVGANQPGAGGTSASGAGGSSAGGAEGTNTNIGLNQGGGTQAGTPGNAAAGAGGGPAVVADAGSPDAGAQPAAPDAGRAAGMSFFVTSRGSGNGGNFGGLAGADQLCKTLATAVSPAIGAKTWRAYLSTSTVNARDRIGTGPWTNAAGVVIGTSVAQLHDQAANGAAQQTWPLNNPTIALDERGAQVPLQPLVHDILTGSIADGTVSPLGTCGDWTQTTGNTSNGHSNRAGQATNGGVASSWNFSHVTGCAEPTANFQQGTVSQGGGRGSIYCFATD